MNDRHAQFLIAVGDLCTAAGLAGLAVELRVDRDGGDVVRGIPYAHHAAEDGEAVNDTGYARGIVIDDRIIDLAGVESCTVFAPDVGREVGSQPRPS